jgi:2-iminobutanoate/2-iminopropanoate deaminase
VKQGMQPSGIAVPTRPYSPVVIDGDLVAVSGQVPLGPDGSSVDEDFGAQVNQVLRNLTACLDAAGCEPDHVIKVVAYLTDRRNFATFNEIYAGYFAEPRPVRTTILCGLMDERFLVEIDVIARRPAS